MGFHLSRTLAIKAALAAGLLLIFFNLIGLRLEIKFDRSPIAHTSVPLHLPKRTNLRIQNYAPVTRAIPTSTKQTPIESVDSSQDAFSTTNNSSTINNTNKVKDLSANNNIRNISDIKLIHSVSESKTIELGTKSAAVKKEISLPNTEVHHVVKQRKPLIKKTKYQDFDASLVNEDGILNSIMKVLGLNQCSLTPPDLFGPIEADAEFEELESVEKKLSDKIQLGGRFRPTDCRARDRVAVVIPYRDRKQHLPVFLKNIHPFLMKQQIDYGIFIVEQSEEGSFNRAKLMNVGFVEALKTNEWDCFVFHDIDLLPLDDRNLYTCPDQPRHLSVAVDTLGFKLPYNSIFGGVSSMTTKQFQSVNGFSNSFWGWGGEDDDLSRRLKHGGFHIARYPVNIARYTMLSHKKEKANPKRYEKLVTGANRFNTDGLNSLKYKLLDFQLKPLYTWIYVDITPETS